MRLERPVLQVALDFENLSRAIQAATEAVAGGADWVEAGTPLIKSEGLDAVRALKKAFPSHRVVADMKVMRVPPCPSLAAVKLPAMYAPSSMMLAVLTPSVTVSVPLTIGLMPSV